MSLDDADTELFKAWVIKELEAVSDADSEVLADYVIALVKTEDAQASKIALSDFLGSSAEGFVDDVYRALATKSYDPSRPQPRPTAAIYEPLRRASFGISSLPNQSRKRSYQDWDAANGQDGRIQAHEGANRTAKQPRRGKGGMPRGAKQSSQQMRHLRASPYMQLTPQLHVPLMPAPPAGMPPFDPNDPFAAAMMAAMGQAMGYLPPMSGVGGSAETNGYPGPPGKQRCRDYDTKGFCTRGASCPYEHGDNVLVVPQDNDEYDPTNAMMFDIPPSRVGQMEMSLPSRSRGRGGGASYRGGRPQRADFSARGMKHNRSITSIAVEQIPEQHFSEQSVRDFFSAFGNVEEVAMQPYKRLAIVRYDNYESAKAAHSSPKSVFDNRHVKVYWHKPENIAQPTNGHFSATANDDVEMDHNEPDFDLEKVARKQAEAQRKHDETMKQRAEVEQRRQDLEDKLKAVDAERKKMTDLIAKKTGKPADKDAEDEQTAVLKAKLAELQSEALSLGIDPDADDYPPYSYPPPTYGHSPYRGRGGYGGRSPSRGRGYQFSYRGGYGGGGFSGGRATMSLDNRPKTVAFTFETGQYQEHEAALKMYLTLSGLETATLSKLQVHDGTVLVSFQQRYEAENVMAAALYDGPLAASDLPKQLGKVALAWHKPEDAAIPINGSRNGDVAQGDGHSKAEDEEHADSPAEYQPVPTEDRDMDTYDE